MIAGRAAIGAALWLVTSTCAIAGCRVANEDCEVTCADLDRCGFLPSSLGAASPDGSTTAQENCVARCTSTDEEARAPVGECLAHMTPTCRAYTGLDEVWLEPGSCCSAAAACLDTRFPGSGMLGISSIGVTLASGTASSDACAEPSGPFSLCDAAGVQSIALALLQRNGVTVADALVCDAGTEARAVFHEVPTGVVEPTAILRGRRCPPDGEAYCRVVEFPPIVVGGGESREVRLELDGDTLTEAIDTACTSSAACVALCEP